MTQLASNYSNSSNSSNPSNPSNPSNDPLFSVLFQTSKSYGVESWHNQSILIDITYTESEVEIVKIISSDGYPPKVISTQITYRNQYSLQKNNCPFELVSNNEEDTEYTLKYMNENVYVVKNCCGCNLYTYDKYVVITSCGTINSVLTTTNLSLPSSVLRSGLN